MNRVEKWTDLPKSERLNILNEVSVRRGLPAYVIEKDLWVTQTLRFLTGWEYYKQLVFKGGTSLSKAWGIINRFSEDIDLAINREFFGFSGDISRTQVGKLKDKSNKFISNDFLLWLQKQFKEEFSDVEVRITDSKHPDDDPVKIEILYPTITQYSDYIKPRVLLEIGSRSLIEPYSEKSFRSMIGEEFPSQPFTDRMITFACVNPERTFLEKIFLLHEEHQRPAEKMKIEGRSRHFYDLYKIAQTGFFSKVLESKDLYKEIVHHRSIFTKLGGVNYESHFPPTLNKPNTIRRVYQ